jgi:hypothetical protein
MLLQLVPLLALAVIAPGSYALGRDVVELTPANFKAKVLDSDDVWLVEFYGLSVLSFAVIHALQRLGVVRNSWAP